jgi:6-phosphogluconolactonase
MRKEKLSGLLFACTVIVTICISCSNSSEDKMQFFVGTYAAESDPGIYSCELDLKTKQVTVLNTTFGIENPSFLALSPDQKYLYAVSETSGYGDSESGGVYSFRIDQRDNGLKMINSAPSGGAHPCHVSVHPSGKTLFVANYSGGNIAAIQINADGGLNPEIQTVQHLGSGPVSSRQEKAHAHSVNIMGRSNLLYACDLGIDKVMGYRVNPETGSLTHSDAATLAMDPGSGPRHMCFSSDNRFAYVINELNSTVSSCSLNPETGELKIFQSVSTLPRPIEGENYCADIHIHPGGEYLYASNRGHNSIAVFKIAGDGSLSMIQTHTSMGDWPRNFAIDPSGRFLLVANQRTGNIVVLEINQETGMLKDTVGGISIPDAVCILISDKA